MHIELILEEPSAEAFFQGFFPRILPAGTTWNPIVFQGKADLLLQLEKRLKGYSAWIPEDWKIVVLVDEDREDCGQLKEKLEAAARAAGLSTKSAPKRGRFTVLNRIAVEEIEAWFLGDPMAVSSMFKGVSPYFGSKAGYRDPDAIAGGTWEALERLLQKAGYYPGGLAKMEVARKMAACLDASRNTSKSFRHFVEGITSLLHHAV
ncbi:DUF4276 family protein [Luteolibacter sp. LG18]|uniref:DUF4276 family protein n=1 Tax=Luteolibacter sp. LG18 TaxID=2819286 RepID=UPI002B305659|nr:hypothetical protein llg_39860 [Luteolibacter sp. LG18]